MIVNLLQYSLDITDNIIDICVLISSEATAASNAGMQTLILTRPGNAELDSQQLIKFETIKTFHDLTLVLSKKEENDAVNLDNDQRKKITKEYQEKNITIT